MIKAEIVADSVNTIGERITTMLVTFPRFILAELNTHRIFSRNSASSRAIPFEKMVKAVQENPFIPIAWQKNHKGMQGSEYITNIKDIEYRKNLWLKAKKHAVRLAKDLNNDQAYPFGDFDPDIKEGGVTKQICNRLLEPFMWHTVLITATEWENFFALRCPQYTWENKGDKIIARSREDFIRLFIEEFHTDGEIELHDLGLVDEHLNANDNLSWFKINKGQSEIHMMALAEAMWDAYNESEPKLLQDGEWHIPFESDLDDTLVDDTMIEKSNGKDRYREFLLTKIKIATARCARTSYTVVGEEGKEYSYEADIKLHDKLLADRHMSPMEHCAQAMPGIISRNFKGFKQYREIVENKD